MRGNRSSWGNASWDGVIEPFIEVGTAAAILSGMKTFTPFLIVFGSIAGVVAPGFASAGVYVPLGAVLIVAAVVAALIGYAIFTSSVDQVRTGSSVATQYKTVQPAPVAKMLPAAKTVREKRRVSAIIEIAA